MAAEKGASVTVFEAGASTLTKVKISGGGRCNVLHDTSKPVGTLLAGYPRGCKELISFLMVLVTMLPDIASRNACR